MSTNWMLVVSTLRKVNTPKKIKQMWIVYLKKKSHPFFRLKLLFFIVKLKNNVNLKLIYTGWKCISEIKTQNRKKVARNLKASVHDKIKLYESVMREVKQMYWWSDATTTMMMMTTTLGKNKKMKKQNWIWINQSVIVCGFKWIDKKTKKMQRNRITCGFYCLFWYYVPWMFDVIVVCGSRVERWDREGGWWWD